MPDCFHLRRQHWPMDRDNFPDAFEVCSQVIVHQNVSEARNGAPVNRCKAGRPSQGNRLPKHARSDQRMKCTLFSDVDAAAQLFLQVGEQPPWKPRRRMRSGLNQ